jgi:hypothetical protein
MRQADLPFLHRVEAVAPQTIRPENPIRVVAEKFPSGFAAPTLPDPVDGQVFGIRAPKVPWAIGLLPGRLVRVDHRGGPHRLLGFCHHGSQRLTDHVFLQLDSAQADLATQDGSADFLRVASAHPEAAREQAQH